MKKRILAALVACTVALSLAASAFAVAPGSSNGKVEAKAEVVPDAPVAIATDLGLTLDADAGVFGAEVTEINANVEVASMEEDSEDTVAVKAAVVEALTTAIEDAVSSGALAAESAKTSIKVNTVITVSLTDQNGNALQPVNGKVKVTIPYDGVSNFVAYLNSETGVVEFFKLTVDGDFATFETTHFSDYYMVQVDNEEVIEKIDIEKTYTVSTSTAGDTTDKTDDDKNQNTGVFFAVIPAAIAGAAVIVAKKRK